MSTYDWQHPIGAALQRRYEVKGWSHQLFLNDWALLRRACGPRHPSQITTGELEEIVLGVATQGGRVNYVHRFRSLFRSLRELGLIPPDHRPDDGLPQLRRPRAVPRPISAEQAEHLMAHAAEPMREWFVLACLAGLRAMEVSKIEGQWLEQGPDGPTLRVVGGKGGHTATIPAHRLVVEAIESHRTFGRLYRANPTQVSRWASEEMRRLGINATFHACRHFYGTALMEKCGDLLVVSELMRHASLQSTRGYVALQQGRKRAVLDSLFAEARQGGHGDVRTA
jgi:integrase